MQARIIHTAMLEEVTNEAEPTRREILKDAVWAIYARASQSCKDEAEKRLSLVKEIRALSIQGSRHNAVCVVGNTHDISSRTLYRWDNITRDPDLCTSDWMAALTPTYNYRGRSKKPCDRRAWDHLVGNYLRPAQRSFQACYDDMKEAALAHGWGPILSPKAFKKRIEDEFGVAAITMAHKGESAAARLYPAQTRDRSSLHAMEMVNADGHVFDVFVKWEDGMISRPISVGFQDVYSGFILSQRIGRTENKELVHLALADMIESWGIPEHAYFDNGRAFMNKCLTGRMRFRYRFPVRDEDPEGILENLSVKVHAVSPYSGQSKPIERAWRDVVDPYFAPPCF